MILASFARAAAPLLKNGSRTLPFGVHSFRAIAFNVSSVRLVIVRFASTQIIERLNAEHEGIGWAVGVAEGFGSAFEVQVGGDDGTETLVARNSQLPE